MFLRPCFSSKATAASIRTLPASNTGANSQRPSFPSAGVKNGKIAGFVAVGMGLPLNSGETPYRPELLEQIAVPVLDIYGSRDSDAAMQEAGRRTEAARKGGALVHRGQQLDPLRRSATARFPVSEQSGYITYRQMELAGADHFFTAYDHVLTKRIAGWLRKHATGVAVPRAGSSDAAAPGEDLLTLGGSRRCRTLAYQRTPPSRTRLAPKGRRRNDRANVNRLISSPRPRPCAAAARATPHTPAHNRRRVPATPPTPPRSPPTSRSTRPRDLRPPA